MDNRKAFPINAKEKRVNKRVREELCTGKMKEELCAELMKELEGIIKKTRSFLGDEV